MHPFPLKMFLLIAAGLVASAVGQSRCSGANPETPDGLFATEHVVDVRLRVPASEWAKLQPPPDARTGGWSVMMALDDVIQDAKDRKHFRKEGAAKPGLAGYLGIQHQYGQADVIIDGETISGVGLRFKGNGTFLEGFAKQRFSYKIDFNEFDDLGAFRGLTKLNLHSNVTDASMFREPLSYALFREAGIPCPRIGWANVWLSITGEEPAAEKFLGLYTLVEQVDKRFLQDRFGSDDGLLLKPSTFGAFRYLGEAWPEYELAYVPKTEGTPSQRQQLIDFARLLQDASDEEFAAEVERYLDVDQFVRFLAVNVLLSNLDSFLGNSQNFYVYLDPDAERFILLPWDLDHSFGAFPLLGTPAARMDLSIRHPGGHEHQVIERVLWVPQFRELYETYLRDFAETIFNPEKLRTQIKATADFVSGALSAGEGYHQPDKAALEAKTLERFVVTRHESVLRQLDGKSDGTILHAEFSNFSFRAALFFFFAFMGVLLLNGVGWLIGIVAGFRGSALWGCLNLCFYPICPLVYGGFVRPAVGRTAAIWAIVGSIAMVVWGVCLAVFFT